MGVPKLGSRKEPVPVVPLELLPLEVSVEVETADGPPDRPAQVGKGVIEPCHRFTWSDAVQELCSRLDPQCRQLRTGGHTDLAVTVLEAVPVLAEGSWADPEPGLTEGHRDRAGLCGCCSTYLETLEQQGGKRGAAPEVKGVHTRRQLAQPTLS